MYTRPSRIHRPSRSALGNHVIMLVATCAFAVQMFLDPSAQYLRGLVLRTWSASGLFGYMWLHMTVVHLVGNLITLWVIGRCVCPKLGDVTYTMAYVAAGIGAGLVHIACDGRPAIGASGAIMGVLGMYVVICFGQFGRFGPWLVLIWFLVTLGSGVVGGSPACYMSHVGGFLTGMFLAVCVAGHRAAAGSAVCASRAVLPRLDAKSRAMCP